MRIVFLAAFALGAAGCGEPDENANTFTAYGAVNKPLGAQTTVRAVMPGRTVVFSDADLKTVHGDKGSFAVAPLIPTSGTMRVTIVVTASPADTIALAEIPFELASKHSYSVQVQRAPANQSDHFFGPGTLVKFPLRGSERASTDSLRVHVFNGIPCRDCVY